MDICYTMHTVLFINNESYNFRLIYIVSKNECCLNIKSRPNLSYFAYLVEWCLAHVIKYHFIKPSQTAAFLTFAVCAKLIHLVILQSLGDTTFFKRAIQTDSQTRRAYKWLQVPPFNQTVNVGNNKEV